jgi:hypothetical protein
MHADDFCRRKSLLFPGGTTPSRCGVFCQLRRRFQALDFLCVSPQGRYFLLRQWPGCRL